MTAFTARTMGVGMSTADLDLIVYGATSFVGRITCAYLARRAVGNEALRWGMAARSASRLEALRGELGEDAQNVPMIVADAADDTALAALCARTRVVASTVGPYALYGEPLVRACATSGTDYCDLTGEVQWIRRMIERYDGRARASGARIVTCCGFDSIPSDLGVWFLQRHITETAGEPATQVQMRVESARGGVSGGTIASLMNLMEEASHDRALRAELKNPYSLCPDDGGPRPAQREITGARFDPDFGTWTAPFVMAAINTRIVLRSHALSGYPYGRQFRYDEAMLTGSGVRGTLGALAVAAGTGGIALTTAFEPTRRMLRRFLPKPGEGPSAEARANGHFALRFLGSTPRDARFSARVTGDADPGYGSTAKMFAESGACLARDVSRDEVPGGFWTPATALGAHLLPRLEQYAGMSFAVVDSPAPAPS
jgi:short subunit dehydrogenase-like uncharacterized protein